MSAMARYISDTGESSTPDFVFTSHSTRIQLTASGTDIAADND